MKVFQCTRNKQNLFFKPDRLDRFYGYSFLTSYIFRDIDILHVRLIKVTHSWCVHCGLSWSLPFCACFAITVISVIFLPCYSWRSPGCTLRFRPLSTRRRFTSRKSITMHPGKCLYSKNLRAFCWKRAFFISISKLVFFCPYFWCQAWTQPRKGLGSKVDILSTKGGTFNFVFAYHDGTTWSVIVGRG